MSDNEAETEADAEPETEETESGIQQGDFVRLDYTVRTKSDDRVVDTTRQDVAEEAGIDDDEYEFEPRIIVVGEGHVFPGVDDALVGSEAGDEGTVEITAEDGFGEYNQEQVRTVSVNKIDEENRRPGAQVQIDGEQGYIETVIGGRARVDFNHPLAGEELEYEYEVIEVVDDDEEKAAGLLGMYLQMEPDLRIEMETVEEEDEEGEIEEVEQRTLYIEASQQMQMNQQWMFQKQQVAQDLMDRLDLDRVVVEEVFDGSGGGMMGGMGGMMGGMGGAGDIEEEIEDLEGELEDADVDAEEIVDELEDADEE
jgi:FKBP-type peptidyl-prolyl cis-trans isomerase SlyD